MTTKLTMSEAELLSSVIDCAHLYGWKCAHFRPAQMTRKDGSVKWVTAVQGDGKGFPDLVLARRESIIFAECKSEKGKLTPEQEDWYFSLSHAYIWRPSDWLDGTIEKILK